MAKIKVRGSRSPAARGVLVGQARQIKAAKRSTSVAHKNQKETPTNWQNETQTMAAAKM